MLDVSVTLIFIYSVYLSCGYRRKVAHILTWNPKRRTTTYVYPRMPRWPSAPWSAVTSAEGRRQGTLIRYQSSQHIHGRVVCTLCTARDVQSGKIQIIIFLSWHPKFQAVMSNLLDFLVVICSCKRNITNETHSCKR